MIINNNIILELNRNDVDDFVNNGKIPLKIDELCNYNPINKIFTLKKDENVIVGTVYDIIDKEFDNIDELDNE